ncbi:MAG: hypothetical protein INR62_02015 [Rhodospirillales bacterium]|nr:hypothetical protein [Acetobacter sp.]
MSDRRFPIQLPVCPRPNLTGASSRSILALRPLPQCGDLQTASHHEAGHAAGIILSGGLYWLRGISMRARTVDPLPERYRHTGAHLTIDPQARMLDLLVPEQRSRAEALLVIVMAGVVAEQFLLRKRHRERAFRYELSCHGLFALLHFHGGDCPSTAAGSRRVPCTWWLATGAGSAAWPLRWPSTKISPARKPNGS